MTRMPPGAPSLAYSTVCHRCDHPYISVIRDFPVPYICASCAAAIKNIPRAPQEPPQPEPLTTTQKALLGRIAGSLARMDKLGDRITAERHYRDELFVKAVAKGLSVHELAMSAGLSTGGVTSAIYRARGRSKE